MTIPAYFILGSPTSGRRGTVLAALKNGCEEDEFCGVFVSAAEDRAVEDDQIYALKNVELFRYRDPEDSAKKIAELDTEKYSKIFYVSDSTRNLADEIDDFKSIADAGGIRLARIWSVIDCSMLWRFPHECRDYADALSHFADCLLLSRRAGVPNKAVAEIAERYEKMCRPHLTVLLDKNFAAPNFVELMVDETRRISMYFDEYDPEDELNLDEENLPEEPFDLERKLDPYLEKTKNGLRLSPIKEVAEFALKARIAEEKENEKV